MNVEKIIFIECGKEKNKGSFLPLFLKNHNFMGHKIFLYFLIMGNYLRNNYFLYKIKNFKNYLYILLYRFLFWLILLIKTFDIIMVTSTLTIIKRIINKKISDKINIII